MHDAEDDLPVLSVLGAGLVRRRERLDHRSLIVREPEKIRQRDFQAADVDLDSRFIRPNNALIWF